MAETTPAGGDRGEAQADPRRHRGDHAEGGLRRRQLPQRRHRRRHPGAARALLLPDRSTTSSSPCSNGAAGRNVERMAEALASPEPLRAWWELASDPRGTALFVELLAAANHRPALKAEVGGDRPRGAAACRWTCSRPCSPSTASTATEFPPALVAAAIQGLAFSAVQDQRRGLRHRRPTRRSLPWDASSTSSRARRHR